MARPSVVIHVVLGLVLLAASAAAQTGTATQSPAVRLFSFPTEPTVEDPPPGCALSPTLPWEIARSARQEAILLKNLTETEADKEALSGAAGRLHRLGYEVSVAATEAAWRTAVVQLRSAVSDLMRRAEDGAKASTAPSDSAIQQAHMGIQARLSCFDSVLRKEAEKPTASVRPTSQRAASLLTAATIATGNGTREVSARPVDYFFSNNWRLYVRSTLVLDKREEPADGASSADTVAATAPTDTAAEAPAANDLAESVKAALLDPFGGPLNVAAGFHTKLFTPFLHGYATDGAHGVFIDARIGLRFIELPEDSLTLVDGTTRVTPFYQGSAGLRLILPVFKDSPGADNPGGVEIALTAAVTRVATADASELFTGKDGADPLLKKTGGSVHLAIAISLPGWASLDISGNVWSNSKFDRRFLIGLTLRPEQSGTEGAQR
ncbi:MAG: hypothetical protein Q8L86_12990 [Vicinamibacterales bacterium]|nr:hypothetical protein [Vicinamibacterales bacterium]